jgi:hypothetical protein
MTLNPRIMASAPEPEILKTELDPLSSIVAVGPSRMTDPVVIVTEPDDTIALPLITRSDPDVIVADSAVNEPDGTAKFIDWVLGLHTPTVPEFGM